VRSYYAFFSEEVAQVKNVTPTTSSIIASTVTIISIIIITTTVTVAHDAAAAAANTHGAVLVASAAQVVSVPNAHRDVQIQNPRGSSSAADFAPARFGRVRGFAADLPDRAAPAHVDAAPARTAGPLSGLGLAGGVAPGARRAVYLPGQRSSGEELGSGTRISRGPAPGKGPYVDVQFRGTR